MILLSDLRVGQTAIIKCDCSYNGNLVYCVQDENGDKIYINIERNIKVKDNNLKCELVDTKIAYYKIVR